MMMLCIALHLYAGPIAPSTNVIVAMDACHAQTIDDARALIAACSDHGALRCEVIVSKGVVTLENKFSFHP